MSMTPEQMRELDVWIAVNLFGKKAISKDGPRPTKGTEDDYFVIEFIHISKSLPHYTTDPACAFEVLKKCAEHDVGIYQCDDKSWTVGKIASPIIAFAPTLELAIALCARKIFTKET